MKRRLLCLLVSACAAAGLAQAPAARFSNAEILVKFKPNTAILQAGLHAKYRTRGAGTIPRIGVTRVLLPAGMSADAAVSEFRKMKSAVAYAEKNSVYDYSFTPNDSGYPTQYHHLNLQSSAAWDITFGSISVNIAICDSGVMLNHEDLAPKVLFGTDTFEHDSDPSDDVGHGTFVAGLAAAATNNGKGISGVGFNCRILPVKVGGPEGVPSDAAAEGIAWAADNGANVINLSFGGPSPSQTMKDAIDYATNVKNVIVIAAAGNFNTILPLFPAAYPNVLSVGATDENDQRAPFSNYGAWVDVAAPGVDVYSTLHNGGYTFASGTSFSAPIVSGLAGLLWSKAGPTATAAEIRGYIQGTCDSVGGWLNFGRVNAPAALDAVIQIDEIDYDPIAASVFTGVYGGGNVGSLATTDGSMYFILAAKVSGLGFVAALQGDFTVPEDPADINSLSVQLSTMGPPRTTQFVYVWNWQSGQYEFLKSFPITSAVTSNEVQLGMPFERYIEPTNKTVRILLRGVGQTRFVKQMVYGVDRFAMKSFVRTH